MDQSGQQQQRLAQGLRSLADELSSMARGSDQQGVASQAASRGASEVRRAAEYLDARDPGSLVEEIRGFARRRPGTFLAVAAGLGVVGGRLTRGMAKGRQDDGGERSTGSPSTVVAGTTGLTGTTGVTGRSVDAGPTGVPTASTGLGDTSTGAAVPVAGGVSSPGVDGTVWADATTAARDTHSRAPDEPAGAADPLREARP